MRFSLAAFFIVLGIIGTALPVIPQTIFFVIGLLLLGFRLEWILNKIEYLPKYGRPLAQKIRTNSWIKEFLND